MAWGQHGPAILQSLRATVPRCAQVAATQSLDMDAHLPEMVDKHMPAILAEGAVIVGGEVVQGEVSLGVNPDA